jgi:hypothetical protein
MEIRVNSIINFVFIIGLFLVSCRSNEQKIDPLKVCSEFYDLNKDVNFSGLLNVQILGIRERSEFNDSILKYNRIPAVIGINDSISKENIKLPSFSRNADMEERKLFFARCDSSCITYLKNKYNIHSNDSIFEFYIKEIETIYSNYYQIKVPDDLPYTNIELIGRGNFIKFVLYKNEEKKINYRCYYVEDPLFSNERLKEYFDTLPKFNEHWYYDLN